MTARSEHWGNSPPGFCSETGVLGALTGILGAMRALEVIREIVGFGKGLVGRLMLVDALGMPTTFFSGLFAGSRWEIVEHGL